MAQHVTNVVAQSPASVNDSDLVDSVVLNVSQSFRPKNTGPAETAEFVRFVRRLVHTVVRRSRTVVGGEAGVVIGHRFSE